MLSRLTNAVPIFMVFALYLWLGPAIGCGDERIRELFDGRSLDGWEGDSNYWRVEKGSIVGEIPAGKTLRRNTWLVWRGGKLTDFDLRLQFKLSGAPSANSGIQFRCQVDGINHVSGYQADLDQGATWLGRIYDEHGRALLVERGSRVSIDQQGKRAQQAFAPARQYAVLFRQAEWNDYRIVAIGERIAVYVNGTLFSELVDQQAGERDLQGALALQLHSGPQTRIEFRNIQLEGLKADDTRLDGMIETLADSSSDDAPIGEVPRGADGQSLNLGFEAGDLTGWKADGDAFRGQPVNRDGIAGRWPGQTSNKSGEFFIGGFEVVQDGGVGTLTSAPFKVTHPFASFLIAGGDSKQTRVDVVLVGDGNSQEQVLFSASGQRREQMRRVAVDLNKFQGRQIRVRLVDETRGPWGHLNFDDFRFHAERPATTEPAAAWRSTFNPLLQHLVPTESEAEEQSAGTGTVDQMFVPAGFSVDVIAAEPQLHQPMAFTFDAKGRLWVVEGHSYPKKRPAGEGLDRILIFADDDNDGRFESRKVFTEGLNLVSGLEVGYGGVWVGAAPELLFIPDRDGDDRPDGPPEVLLDGFGFADTHETLNSFLWGPDGWLYGNQGVFNTSKIGKPGSPDEQRSELSAGVWRYHPTKHQFEVFAHGGSNQWGLDYDQHGQLFMTHCRSRWGTGPTTHVMQGGHYWNQVNGGYAPFVSATALPGMPEMRNYMLASARYGHGEGGAGRPGSREVFGGHSHVGTMIYLGDNWPGQYHNRLFTHNLHGHQINQQVNRRSAGGYRTLHAGQDVLFCADRQYIGVDLKYGPDGAVYISDWYDPRHCHNPNVEQWDRGNGRMYRMQYDANYRPVSVDYDSSSDGELVQAQHHQNAWHARTARRVLAERSADRRLSGEALPQLREIALQDSDEAIRLRGLWAVHAIGGLDANLAAQLMKDDSEYVRAWTVQLAVESLDAKVLPELLEPLADHDDSLLVRRYLASALPRVDAELGWAVAARLAAQSQNNEDDELCQLLWYGVADLMAGDVEQAFRLSDSSHIDSLRNYIDWYAAKLSPRGRERLIHGIANASADDRIRPLALLTLGVRGMRGLALPKSWQEISAELYDASDARVRQAAESIGTAFGDQALYQRMRQRLLDGGASVGDKRQSLRILASDNGPQNLPLLLELLDDQELSGAVIPLLARYDQAKIGSELIARLSGWQGAINDAAMSVLSARSIWAEQLLDAIAAGDVDKQRLTAYYVRQMSGLGDPQLNARLAKEWGALKQSSAERQQEIAKMVKAFSAAPLWAYSAGEGAKHFKKLCANCHQANQQNESLGPKLAGTGTKGIQYIVENVIDPNAVIGRDFQARLVITDSGRVISGLVEKQTDSAITIRTATESVTVPVEEIEQTRVSENSFMPEGLLKDLNDRERIELFKYLMTQ